jgi:hypothetical protein
MEHLNLYIAGPMRGYLDLNRGEFFKAEDTLRAKGIYKIINPCTSDDELGLTPKQLESTDGLRIVMSRDLSDISTCDVIYMLNGWEKSEGAKIEHSLATMLNMTILYQ